MTGYTALVDIGLLSGAAIVYLAARRRGLDATCVLDAMLTAALGGLVGGRAMYVVAHWDYYQDYVHRALRLWDGGLSWHGALAGGLAGVLTYRALRKLRGKPSQRISLQQTLDVLTPGAAMVATCAWLGCLTAGCAYGLETYPVQEVLWKLSMELPDLYGIQAPRVAVQLLGAGWGAVVLIVVLIAGRSERFAGLVFPLWLTLHSTGSFGLEFLRADEVPMIISWRADQMADLALTLFGCTALIAGLFRQRRHQERQQWT